MAAEVKLHVLQPARKAKEFAELFPNSTFSSVAASSTEEGDESAPVPMMITVAVQTENRMTALSEEVIGEREAAFKRIVDSCQAFRGKLQEGCPDAWCDFIDPSTGAPFHTDSPTTLMETDE